MVGGAVVPVAVAAPRRQINPLLPICGLGCCLFLIASTIVLALIPVYLERRGEDIQNNQNQFTASLALRNGTLPLGPLSDENCRTIEAVLRQRALSSPDVSPSVPTVQSCTVSGNSAALTKRKKRQTQGNQIDLVGTLSGRRNCNSGRCLRRRLRAFLALLLSSGDFILPLVIADGRRINVAARFVTGSASGVTANPNIVFYGLNNQNQLLRISTQAALTVNSRVTVTGLNGAERLLSIDFRPATGQLYGVTDGSRLYQIDQDSGVARAIGNVFNPTIVGSIVSIDFNPTVDRIRLVTNSGQNLRLNPETGAVVGVDGAINGGNVVAVAYTNNRAGASNTTLFDIDSTTDRLFQQNPPNAGTLVPVGSTLGTDINGTAGFDIAPSGLALTSIVSGTLAQLFLIDLTSGRLGQNLGYLSEGLIAVAIPTDTVAYAVTTNNNSLVIFNPLNTNIAPVLKSITGLAAGETILGLDFRPVTSQLYGLGSSSRLYTLDTSSGAATAVGTGAPFAPVLAGTNFGFDFNPTVDRVRAVSNTGQNLRLNPDTGALAGQDGNLNPNTPTVTALAYTNNVANAASTVLYDLDSGTNRLLIQNPPNPGTLVDVGPLGVDFDEANGFDIGGKSGAAYALLTVSGVTRIYQVNLTTGAATSLGVFPLPARAFALGLGF